MPYDPALVLFGNQAGYDQPPQMFGCGAKIHAYLLRDIQEA